MTLQSSGAISLGDIQTEFGGSNPIGINEYYGAASGVPASGTISIADFYGKALPSMFVVTSGRVLPFGGDGSSGWPPSGYTSIQNSSVDDASLQINLPFAYRKNGVNYTSFFVGSNSYITFGSGSSAFSGLSGSNPNVPTLHIGSADNSYQRVAYKSSTNYLIVRFEGAAATSGTVSVPGIVWEATFFRETTVNAASTSFNSVNWTNIIMLNVGTHNRTNGLFGISNGSVFNASGTIAAGQSYLIMGEGVDGSNQRILTNARMVNASEGYI